MKLILALLLAAASYHALAAEPLLRADPRPLSQEDLSTVAREKASRYTRSVTPITLDASLLTSNVIEVSIDGQTYRLVRNSKMPTEENGNPVWIGAGVAEPYGNLSLYRWAHGGYFGQLLVGPRVFNIMGGAHGTAVLLIEVNQPGIRDDAPSDSASASPAYVLASAILLLPLALCLNLLYRLFRHPWNRASGEKAGSAAKSGSMSSHSE